MISAGPLPSPPPWPEVATGEGSVAAVVVGERGQRFALEVDGFAGEFDLVVRPLDARLGKSPDVAAVSMLQDGRPVLILDVEDLARSIDALVSGGRLSRSRRAAADQPERRIKRVLVIDDSLTVRELERRLLEGEGYAVEIAVDGMEGWNALGLADYDLILTDVDMPRMNGIELTRRIKADARLRGMPVVIVSYKDRDEDRMRGLESGADHYLTKSSFQDETLVRVVRDLIGGAGGVRIAIVNDLALAVEALRRTVRSIEGASVAWVARDGGEAIALCGRDRPDLVLMDLVMPGIDGVAATREIMQRSPCPVWS